MKIPRSFGLFGQTITVVECSQDEFDTNCQYGAWDPSLLEISIRKDLHRDLAAQTFWHEWLHAAFEAAGHAKLSSDEVLVDTLAGLLTKALRTAKYK